LKKKWFWRFSVYRCARKKRENQHIHMFNFYCVAKNIEGWLKICTLFLAYSQIWLNLPRDDCHFFHHLPMDDCHFDNKQKFLTKTLVITWTLTKSHNIHNPIFSLSSYLHMSSHVTLRKSVQWWLHIEG
jgi:hypothetical protein